MRDVNSDSAAAGEPRVIVWSGESAGEAAELALVLAAAGIEHERVTGRLHERLLVVPAAQADRAAGELAAYKAERAKAPPRPRPVAAPAFPGAWIGVAGYAAVLLVAGFCAGQNVFDLEWLGAGELHAGAVMHGQLWRIVTALTLHANAEHLLGNLGFGAFFGYFVGRDFGFGLGWLAILAGGALGDLLDAAFQPADHRAIGASTAVFAALGLLTARAWLEKRGETSWRARVAPIFAGICLLAFTGTAGEHTNVFAHLMGFASGFGIGAVLARLRSRLPRAAAVQRSLATLAVVLVALAWAVGLRFAG